MSGKRSKNKKTAVLTMRVDPLIKAAAELAAERDHRSLTSMIEVLIMNHCKAHDIHPRDDNPKESPSD